MSDSKRLRVLKLLSTWLMQEIRVANGYKHDLAAVIRGRAFFTDDDPLPHVSIVEQPVPDVERLLGGGNDNAGNGVTVERWGLLLEGVVEEDPKYPCDAAYELMADVKKAVAKLFLQDTADAGLTIDMGDGDTPRAYYIGGLTAGVQIDPGTVRPPEHPSEKAFFWMRVILKFTERVKDPYAYT